MLKNGFTKFLVRRKLYHNKSKTQTQSGEKTVPKAKVARASAKATEAEGLSSKNFAPVRSNKF